MRFDPSWRLVVLLCTAMAVILGALGAFVWLVAHGFVPAATTTQVLTAFGVCAMTVLSYVSGLVQRQPAWAKPTDPPPPPPAAGGLS